MTITATDLFAGAGGSSLGAEGVPGVRLAMAANHWSVAVDVHQHHFPEASHDPEAVVDDCGFRMLEPHEIAAAMAFPDGYIPTALSKKDRVKLAGNAVTPPVMRWVVGRVASALERAT